MKRHSTVSKRIAGAKIRNVPPVPQWLRRKHDRAHGPGITAGRRLVKTKIHALESQQTTHHNLHEHQPMPEAGN